MIYRVDDDVDVNIGNSIKIHFSRDSRDSKRSFIHAENINANEMRYNLKKEELFDWFWKYEKLFDFLCILNIIQAWWYEQIKA